MSATEPLPGNDADQQPVDDTIDHDEEYAEAYGFWMYAFGVIGAVVGYNVGSEAGFGFWPSFALAVVGLVAMAIVAFRYRRIVAVVGGLAVLALCIMAFIEGLSGA